jgi:hypothetical protein
VLKLDGKDVAVVSLIGEQAVAAQEHSDYRAIAVRPENDLNALANRTVGQHFTDGPRGFWLLLETR